MLVFPGIAYVTILSLISCGQGRLLNLGIKGRVDFVKRKVKITGQHWFLKPLNLRAAQNWKKIAMISTFHLSKLVLVVV